MKKIISILAITTTLSTPAFAVDRYNRPTQSQINYNRGYSMGYQDGKEDGKAQVGKVLVITAVVAIATVAIYEIGKNSNWGVSENGLTYRF